PLHHCSYDPAIRASTSAALLSARSRSGSFGLLTSRSAQAVAPPRRRSPIAAMLWIFNMCRLSSGVELNAERPCPEVGVLVAFHPCEGSRAEVTATLADLRIVAAVVRPRHEVAPGEDQREAVEGVEDREAAELRRAETVRQRHLTQLHVARVLDDVRVGVEPARGVDRLVVAERLLFVLRHAALVDDGGPALEDRPQEGLVVDVKAAGRIDEAVEGEVLPVQRR